MKQPVILALDTVGGDIHGAVLTEGRRYTANIDGTGKTRSTAIVPLVDALLEKADVDWRDLELLAFSAGPGAFTGLRIAAATLAGINSALHLPVLHLCSLTITARQSVHQAPLWVLEDARAGEAYAGCFESGRVIVEPACRRWCDIEHELEPTAFVAQGEPDARLEGWQRLPLIKVRSEALADAALAAVMTNTDWQQAPRYPAPRYLQLSQAERNANV